MQAEDRWADGTLDVVRIETLQGPEWIALTVQRWAATVPLPLDYRRWGFLAGCSDGQRAMPTQSPAVRAVTATATVNHLNASVLELTLVDGQGR